MMYLIWTCEDPLLGDDAPELNLGPSVTRFHLRSSVFICGFKETPRIG